MLKMKNHNHELLIFLTFFLLISIGTAALKMPFVRHSQAVSLLDALFIATSATCVTGLTTIPTSGFNILGQLIILALIQIGAIGIMTLTASFILFFRGDLDFKNRMMMTQLSVSPKLSNVEGVLQTVVSFTIITEAIGFLFLAIGFHIDGFSLPASMYHALFHTISAFCNAGFSTFDSSLQHTNYLVQIVVMILIVMGGIGYYVVFDCLEYVRKKDRLTIHTKIVMLATFASIISGALLLGLAENGRLSPLGAVFQSVTARTAGFNTVNIYDLQALSLLVLIILMIIGAAPGSTGGGMKLTTLWVIVSRVYNTIRGRQHLVIFNRQVPRENVFRAFTVATIYLLFLVCGVSCLLYFEGRDFLGTLFEMTSAIGTVGLSVGLTPEFGAAGKIILIAGMLGGRVGPAVLVLMLLRPKESSHVEYPTEKLILG